MRLLKIFLVGIFFAAAVTMNVFAGKGMEMEPYKGSADFERLKSLAGVWEGINTMGEEEMPMTVEYFLTSNDSAIVEKTFADTPHEMVSVYHDKGGKLSMTHYCALGNQPVMDLMSSSAKDLVFGLSADSHIDVAKKQHMHALTISFLDEDRILQTWVAYENGSPMPEHAIELTRVK